MPSSPACCSPATRAQGQGDGAGDLFPVLPSQSQARWGDGRVQSGHLNALRRRAVHCLALSPYQRQIADGNQSPTFPTVPWFASDLTSVFTCYIILCVFFAG